jgi:hypothetical protein
VFDDVLPLLIVGDSLVRRATPCGAPARGSIRAQNAWGAAQSVARHGATFFEAAPTWRRAIRAAGRVDLTEIERVLDLHGNLRGAQTQTKEPR